MDKEITKGDKEEVKISNIKILIMVMEEEEEEVISEEEDFKVLINTQIKVVIIHANF
jgi:hypothetical protein